MEKEEKKDARRDGLLRLHEPKLIELNPSTVRNSAKAWFSAVLDFLTYWRLEDLLNACYNVGVDIEVVKSKEYDENDEVQQDYISLMMRHVHYAAGHFAVKAGAMMASFDCFEITLTGQATHAAMPHLGNDAIVAAAQLINALQTIVSRTVNPADSAVVSITQIHAGNTWNAIPESVLLRGTFRCFSHTVKALIADKITQLVNGICRTFDVSAEIHFNPENAGYPVTLNTEAETAIALKAAVAIVGEDCINQQPIPSMGSEDFAFMLQEKPGCYIWIGNGSSENSCLLHNPHYDFNDEILPIGAAYWVKLVEMMLV